MSVKRAEYEERLQIEAAKIKGVPFLHNGRSPSQGLDCLGVIVYIQRAAGIEDFPDTDDPLPSNWHVHATREIYYERIAPYCRMLAPNEPIRVGDGLMFRLGLLYPSAGSKRVQHVALVISQKPGKTTFVQAINNRGIVEGVLQDRAWRTCFVQAGRPYAVMKYLGEM